MEDATYNNSLNSLNALFYKDIANLSAEQFIALFEHKHNLKLTNAEKDFGNQITNVAEICVQKYSLFMVASWFTFGAFVIIFFLVIINSFL